MVDPSTLWSLGLTCSSHSCVLVSSFVMLPLFSAFTRLLSFFFFLFFWSWMVDCLLSSCAHSVSSLSSCCRTVHAAPSLLIGCLPPSRISFQFPRLTFVQSVDYDSVALGLRTLSGYSRRRDTSLPPRLLM